MDTFHIGRYELTKFSGSSIEIEDESGNLIKKISADKKYKNRNVRDINMMKRALNYVCEMILKEDGIDGRKSVSQQETKSGTGTE